MKERCEKLGITLTELGLKCYPKLPANQAYMKMYRLFHLKPKYVEINVILTISETLRITTDEVLKTILESK